MNIIHHVGKRLSWWWKPLFRSWDLTGLNHAFSMCAVHKSLLQLARSGKFMNEHLCKKYFWMIKKTLVSHFQFLLVLHFFPCYFFHAPRYNKSHLQKESSPKVLSFSWNIPLRGWISEWHKLRDYRRFSLGGDYPYLVTAYQQQRSNLSTPIHPANLPFNSLMVLKNLLCFPFLLNA